VYNTLSSVFRS